MAIVVLVLWIATAAAGLTLLRAGGAARRAREAAARPAPAQQQPVRIGAAALTAEGKAPPIVYARVAPAAGGDHTLLEFAHPALAIAGGACWLMFTYIHYAPLAWIAFGFVAVAVLLGLGWLRSSRHAEKHEEHPVWSFPPRLVWLHGSVAAGTVALAVLAAVTASRA